jgi:ubiquinol-cytochrome c reductase cytochrome b subunit
MAHLVNYPTPLNLNWSWNWGSLAGLAYVWRLVSGIVLAMHFGVDGLLGLQSAGGSRSISSFGPGDDVGSGVPSTPLFAGSPALALPTGLHLVRGLYYSSWKTPNETAWLLGLLILLLMILTAFIGYVLPWGQMSFWGATVITSLASAVPVLGWSSASKWLVVHWLWGGFAVDAPTVSRFFSMHLTLPFLIPGDSRCWQRAALEYLSHARRLRLGDLVLVLGDLGQEVVAFFPDWLGHPDNFVPSNP